MRVTYFNTHEVTTTDEDTTGVGFGSDRLAMRRIGRATNPTLALLNHTCDPNYRRISVGRYVSKSQSAELNLVWYYVSLFRNKRFALNFLP